MNYDTANYNTPLHPIRADDALKFAAAILKACTDWTTDGISGSDCDGDHELELDAIDERVREIVTLAATFGDPRRYSDGRLVASSREIGGGLTTRHIWHPDPTTEEPSSWRGNLLSGDPDEPSPGIYEVSTDPATQRLHVCVVRTL